MKPLSLLFALCLCSLALSSPAGAQFRQPPSTAVRRQSELATHVEGDLFKSLGFAMKGRVNALCFSPKSDFLAIATATTLFLVDDSGSRKLLVWDALKQPGELFENRPPVRATIAFSPDSKQLFYCGAQGLMSWKWTDGLSIEQSPAQGWTAPDVYNLTVVDDSRVACAVKRGSNNVLQLRNASDGQVLWEKTSGLLPLTALQNQGTMLRSFTGTPTGTQAYWSQWQLSDGLPSLPIDLGIQNAFSASFSPDGNTGAVVSRSHITANADSLALNIINLETGEAKITTAPAHPFYAPYWNSYFWPDYPYRWPLDGSVDTGWTTLFSPDGKFVASVGKEVVFYSKTTGVVEARIYFSNNPFPDPGITQAETDGVGAFSPDGRLFALVRQARVSYSSSYNTRESRYEMQRRVQGDSAIEIYALGL